MASGSRSTSGTDGTNGTSGTKKSSRRGIVNMLKIKKARSRGIVQKVSWNELGQPIGKGSTSLSYFIGSYARRHVPITCSNWRQKDLCNIKEALWDEVKQTFHGIEEEHKEKIISRAGTLHRQFRTRLRELSRDENGNYSVEPPLLYAHLSTVAPYWKEFVEMSTDVVFVEKSKKNKVQAEAMEARYKKACLGYARIREIIIADKIKAGETNPVVSRIDAWEYARRNASGVVDDPVTLQVLEDVVAISNQLEEHELTNIGTDDLLARLIPLEYPGRVRAVGWGVTKTSMQKHSSGSEITKLKNDIAFLKNEIKEFASLKNEIKELKCKGYIPGAHSGGSSHMDNFDIDNDVSGDDIDDHDTDLSKDLPEGKNPCYLYLDPGRRYVGRGTLWNDRNDRMLHGVSLEEEYVRVQFEVATPSEFKTPLPRPCDEANLVGEAPGYFLAWPRKLVSMNLEIPPNTNKEKKKKKNKEKSKEKNKNAISQEKVKDKHMETIESITGVSSNQLGYPLRQDVSHDGVLELVRVAVTLDRVTDIEIEMGPFWDGDPWIEHINKENVLEVLDEQWLSATSLSFYIRYLSEVYLSKNPNMAAKYSFASPHVISYLLDISKASSILAEFMMGYVDKDHLLFVPYNVLAHWVLVAINTKTESIYFMDPAPRATIVKYKNLKALVETALVSFRTRCGKTYTKTAQNTFKWTNIQCPKQAENDGIFCGHYVGCFIEDVLRSSETSISVNFTRSNRLMCYSPDKMHRFRDNWVGFLYNRFLKGKLLKRVS